MARDEQDRDQPSFEPNRNTKYGKHSDRATNKGKVKRRRRGQRPGGKR